MSTHHFRAVWRDDALRGRLSRAVCQGFLTRLPHLQSRFIERLGQLVEAEGDDDAIHRTLHAELHEEWLVAGELDRVVGEGREWRSANRVKTIRDLLPNDIDIRTILDVGCHDGDILESLGGALGLTPDSLFGCDVEQWSRSARFHALLPRDLSQGCYESKFDLVTMLMVIHHLPEPEQFIRRVFDLTAPAGCVVVREHSPDSPTCSDFFEVLHLLNQKVWPASVYAMSNAGSYLSAEKMDALFRSAGFRVLERTTYYEPLMATYRVYRKSRS